MPTGKRFRRPQLDAFLWCTLVRRRGLIRMKFRQPQQLGAGRSRRAGTATRGRPGAVVLQRVSTSRIAASMRARPGSTSSCSGAGRLGANCGGSRRVAAGGGGVGVMAAAVGPSGRLSCAARLGLVRRDSLRALRALRSDRTPQVRGTKRAARAQPKAVLLGAADITPTPPPPAAPSDVGCVRRARLRGSVFAAGLEHFECLRAARRAARPGTRAPRAPLRSRGQHPPPPPTRPPRLRPLEPTHAEALPDISPAPRARP